MSEPAITKYQLVPPEIIVASNGFVLKQYDPFHDQMVYSVATTPDDVRQCLHEWADRAAKDIQKMADSRLQALAPKEVSNG